MAEDATQVSDQAVAKVASGNDVVSQSTYIVISDNGLFKRGMQYGKGDQVHLDEATAKPFIENGDIENA